MSPTVEVTSLSPNATEKDVHDFFAFCGIIEHVEIISAGGHACAAYVTFENPHAVETAVLLSGATIVDQPVFIARWGHDEDDHGIWGRSSWKIEEEGSSSYTEGPKHVPSAGEAVSLAQDVVKTMVAKGYVLGKDALGKAKTFDESHQVSATAVAKVTELSERFGLVDKLFAGVEAARSVDQMYHITDTATLAANAVVNSSYFSKGALWVSGALGKAAQAASDLGNRGGVSH